MATHYAFSDNQIVAEVRIFSKDDEEELLYHNQPLPEGVILVVLLKKGRDLRGRIQLPMGDTIAGFDCLDDENCQEGTLITWWSELLTPIVVDVDKEHLVNNKGKEKEVNTVQESNSTSIPIRGKAWNHPKLGPYFVVVASFGKTKTFLCIICAHRGVTTQIKGQNYGTTSMWNHLSAQHPEIQRTLAAEEGGQENLELEHRQTQLKCDPVVLTSVKPTNQTAAQDLLDFFVMDDLPLSKLESPFLERFCQRLKPGFSSPNRKKMRSLLLDTFKSLQVTIKEAFRQDPDLKIGLTTDCWTSSNYKGIMVTTAYYVDLQFRPHSLVLGFTRLKGSPKGLVLASELERCIRLYGIDGKVLGCTSDNASNNDSCSASLLSNNNVQWQEDFRVRCFAHIINFAAQVFQVVSMKTDVSDDDMASVSVPHVAFDDEEEEKNQDAIEIQKVGDKQAVKEISAVVVADRNVPIEANVHELMEKIRNRRSRRPRKERAAARLNEEQASYGKRKMNAGTVVEELSNLPIRKPSDYINSNLSSGSLIAGTEGLIQKLRELVKFVRHSTKRRDEFESYRSDQSSRLTLILDVKTRWNSTLAMIDRAISLRDDIEAFLEAEEGGPWLKESEWAELAEIKTALSIFEYPTRLMSLESSPLAMVQPITLEMLRALHSLQPKHESVYRGCRAAFGKLNEFYKDCKTPVYYAATLLDPRFNYAWYSMMLKKGELDQKEYETVVSVMNFIIDHCELSEGVDVDQSPKDVHLQSLFITSSQIRKRTTS